MKEHKGSTERLGNERDVAEKRERLDMVICVPESPTLYALLVPRRIHRGPLISSVTTTSEPPRQRALKLFFIRS
jgi:hypothetical protein